MVHLPLCSGLSAQLHLQLPVPSCCFTSWVASLHTPLSSRHSPLCSLSRLQKPLSQFAFYPWHVVDFGSGSFCQLLEISPHLQPASPPSCPTPAPSHYLPWQMLKSTQPVFVPSLNSANVYQMFLALPAPVLGAGFHNTRDCHSLPCRLVFWGVCEENPSGMLEPFGMLEDDNSQACGECLWSQLSGAGGRRIRHLRLSSAT